MIPILLLFSLCLIGTGMPSTTLEEDLDIERQLKLLNKPPLRTIHTKFGHIVDCIDINKQPAFDHPLLKNHKLQRKPSFDQTIGRSSVKKSLAFNEDEDSCPMGFIPIRRTTKEDLIRARSLLNHHILSDKGPRTHTAGVNLVDFAGASHYGVSGTNSIYNPELNINQSSSVHIWAQSGQMNALNKIMVGWHVFPQLYNGDRGTFIYAQWTSDNFGKTGCINMLCSGFVQTDQTAYLGKRIDNTSIYGSTMIEMEVSLTQDPNSLNWWVVMENKSLGYFPAKLFSNLNSAEKIGWGGSTQTSSEGSPSPQMGSGYLPDRNFLHACYFIHIRFQNSSRMYQEPYLMYTEEYNDSPNCYGSSYYGYASNEARFALQFGGPGGICG